MDKTRNCSGELSENGAKHLIRYDGIGLNYICVPCAKKLTDSELNLPHGTEKKQLEMWANAQRDGRPAEYRWLPLFNPQFS